MPLPYLIHRRSNRLFILMLTASLSIYSVAARADSPLLATIDGQTITQADVDKLIAKDYQEAAVKRLIRRALIDAMAARAGVTVTDADADQTVAKWKHDVLGGDELRYQVELGRQGLTAGLYREVVREGMIADLLVAKPTKLVNADYDQQRVQPLYVRSLEDALQAYVALQRGVNLVNVIRQFNVTLQPLFTVWRYDTRFDRAELNNIWGGDRSDHLAPEVGSFTKPIPSPDGPGFLILQIKEQTSGAIMAPSDREDVGPTLLRQKVNLRMQDWWGALEKQVSAIYAGTGSGKASVVSTGPVGQAAPSTAATGDGVLSIKLIPGAARQ